MGFPTKTLAEVLRSNNEAEIRFWIRNASMEELDEYIHDAPTTSRTRPYAIEERQRRFSQLALQTHWAVMPTFYAAAVAAVASLAALIIALLAWRYPVVPPPSAAPAAAPTRASERLQLRAVQPDPPAPEAAPEHP